MHEDSQHRITGYSIQDVIDFYSDAMNSEAISKRTGQMKQMALKALVEKQIITTEEVSDIRHIDLAGLGKRMAPFFPGVAKATLKAYVARVRPSIKEFLSWKRDDSTFQFRRAKYYKQAKTFNNPYEYYHCCYPIRGGKIILRLDNIPCDLTKEEAEQVSSLMQALLRANAINQEVYHEAKN